MPIINNYDALTGENVSTEMSDSEYVALVGKAARVKSMSDIITENESLKAAALVKLAALGLTEDEAKAIIG